jgi:hypothetical protein
MTHKKIYVHGASKQHRHLSREGLEAVSKDLESLKPVETLESRGLTYDAAADVVVERKRVGGC